MKRSDFCAQFDRTVAAMRDDADFLERTADLLAANAYANPMAPLQRFRCLRPDHANVWDEHVLARDYDALATERDQLAAALEAAREDGARVDWLERHCVNVADEYGAGSQLYLGTYATAPLRAAIDQARGKGVQS